MTSSLHFVDLQAQQNRIRSRIESRFQAILDHGRYIQGPEVEELEAALAQTTGAQDCVAVGNGTQALIMPLMALNPGEKDAVFIPGFTYNATANAVLLSGGRLVFTDVKEDTYTMDMEDLERRLEQAKREGLNPVAIMPVDLYGLPCDYDRLHQLAEHYGCHIIADAAQSFGASLKGRRVGSLAPVTATSFYPAKPLGCYGDGGAIFFMDKDQAELARSLRWHGTGEDRGESLRVGINGRLDSLQCAVVLEKLAIFDEEYRQRCRFAEMYEARLKGHVGLAVLPEGGRAGHGLFTIRTSRRDALRAHLKEAGIPSVIYYPKSLHTMQAFKACAPQGGLPGCERLSETVLSLPMHPYLTEEQVHRVADHVVEFLKA